jgi:hypothetical protein
MLPSALLAGKNFLEFLLGHDTLTDQHRGRLFRLDAPLVAVVPSEDGIERSRVHVIPEH